MSKTQEISRKEMNIRKVLEELDPKLLPYARSLMKILHEHQQEARKSQKRTIS